MTVVRPPAPGAGTVEFNIHVQVLLAVFATAAVMGAVANKTSFCTMGAVSDWLNMGHTGRMRAWAFSMAVALIGVATLEALGKLNLGVDTFPPYRTPAFAWLRYLVGGLLFGVGTTLASGCGSKTLVRIGGGNIKSVTALVAAAACAYLMVWTPVFETAFLPWIRATTIDLSQHGVATQELGSIVSGLFGMQASRSFNLAVAAVVAVGMLIFVFKSPDFRTSHDNVIGGLVVGLAVVGGWYLTGGPLAESWKEYAEMSMVVPSRVQTQSYTFIAPMADAIHYLAAPKNVHLINFGIAALSGVILGSFIYSLVTRTFRCERFVSVKDFVSHVVGGALMGVGGVLAMGRTVGQAITGVSTLAIGSMIAFFSMVIGAAGTMKYQYRRMMQES